MPRSIVSVGEPGIILEAVKLADDGSGDLILRLYESAGRKTRTELLVSMPLAAVHCADLLENRVEPLQAREGRCSLLFRAFEVKTLRLKPLADHARA
jgi:alpha-mannosidase